jgi:hypothetical protein
VSKVPALAEVREEIKKTMGSKASCYCLVPLLSQIMDVGVEVACYDDINVAIESG